MPELTVPRVDVHRSFLEAMDEFVASNDGGGLLRRDLHELGATWHDPAVFAGYVARLTADRLEATPRPAGWVPATTWWLTDGDTYLGRISVRHRLDAFLLETGGHAGYDVRPSARLHGHATAMLRAVIPHARALGIERLLVTCDAGNLGSRRVVERCNGVLDDRRGDKLRFWIATHAADATDAAISRPSASR